MAPVLPFVAAGSALLSAAGAIQQGSAQAAIGARNAQISEDEARRARESAAFEETRARQAAARVRGTQRAVAGKSGVGSEGAALLVMADSAAQSEIDALAIRFSGSIAEQRALSQAALDRAGAKQARTASFFKAGSSLISGAGDFGESLLKKDSG